MYSNSIRPVSNFSVFPPVLKNLLIINGLFFLAQNPADSPIAMFLREWFALWPIGAPDQILTSQGLRATGDFWPWQLLTYGFLHGDLTHILFYMFALWMFGVQLENAWGSRRFAIFYFVCVVGCWFDPTGYLGWHGLLHRRCFGWCLRDFASIWDDVSQQ